MNKVAKIKDDVQEARLPTPAEIKLALYHELRASDKRGDDPKIPLAISSVIDRAFARANAGEFK